MKIRMNVCLNSTLGCGQAHRWVKKEDCWEGVLGDEIITLKQTSDGFECEGTSNKKMIENYFRIDDNLNKIYKECSRDKYIASLIKNCNGLRILRQEPWECLATYLLATNANVKRIGMMVENVCKEFGNNLGGKYSFPTADQIIENENNITKCKLGFREKRFIELAHRVSEGDLVPENIKKLDYENCVKTLMTINGVGPKVADCVALFSMDHLEAFPIDARIEKIMKEKYNVEGSYKIVSEYARKKFGKYCGYSQEFLYHSDYITI